MQRCISSLHRYTARRLGLIVSGAVLVGYITSAIAACRTTPFQFQPTRSDAISVKVECDSTGGQLGVRPRDTVTPAAATIIGYPRSGEMKADSRLSYTYRPHRGFRGNDEFTVRVCAVPSQGQQGCATLTYLVTVK